MIGVFVSGDVTVTMHETDRMPADHILRLSVVPEVSCASSARGRLTLNGAAKIRDLLRHGTAADDTLDSDHIDSPGLQYVHLAHSALLSKIVKHLHDIEGQKSALLQYAATPVDKASMEYQANLRKVHTWAAHVRTTLNSDRSCGSC